MNRIESSLMWLYRLWKKAEMLDVHYLERNVGTFGVMSTFHK